MTSPASDVKGLSGLGNSRKMGTHPALGPDALRGLICVLQLVTLRSEAGCNGLIEDSLAVCKHEDDLMHQRDVEFITRTYGKCSSYHFNSLVEKCFSNILLSLSKHSLY